MPLRSKPSDTQSMRAANTLLVLNALREAGAASRSDLARLTGLSVSALSAIARELLETGLISEQPSDSGGTLGRPKRPLVLNSRRWFVIGVSLTGDPWIEPVLFDLQGTPIDSVRVSLPDKQPHTVARIVGEAVEELCARARGEPGRLLGVGAGVAGVIDADTGRCVLSDGLMWRDVPIRDLLQANLPVPVMVERDANAFALAQSLSVQGKQARSLAVLLIGRGVGAGVVVDRAVYRGHAGAAGELSHCVAIADGPPCSCGRRGCVVTVASTAGLSRLVESTPMPTRPPVGQQPADSGASLIRWLVEREKAGDEAATRILGWLVEGVGRVLALITSLYDPALTIVSAGYPLEASLRQRILQVHRANVPPGLGDHTTVVFTEQRGIAWAWASAALVVQRLFTEPTLALKGMNRRHAVGG